VGGSPAGGRSEGRVDGRGQVNAFEMLAPLHLIRGEISKGVKGEDNVRYSKKLISGKSVQ